MPGYYFCSKPAVLATHNKSDDSYKASHTRAASLIHPRYPASPCHLPPQYLPFHTPECENLLRILPLSTSAHPIQIPKGDPIRRNSQQPPSALEEIHLLPHRMKCTRVLISSSSSRTGTGLSRVQFDERRAMWREKREERRGWNWGSGRDDGIKGRTGRWEIGEG